MRFLRPLFVFLLFALAAAVILSWLLPTHQKVERTVSIQAPASQVYDRISKLENFNKWSAWSRQDSSTKYVMSGTDGTVGASSSWDGDPSISGKGRMEIIALEQGKKINQSVHFIKPDNRKANSVFTLSESNGLTIVTWNFEMETPRPWNIFNLFYSMDKEMGKDFETGLAELKRVSELAAGTAPVKKYEVLQMNFPATRYAIIRQKIKWADISSFFEQHLPILIDSSLADGFHPGTASGLFYEWNEKDQEADLAAAVPVPAGTKIENEIINMVDIPASKAVYVNYTGAYDKELEAYNSLRAYIRDNKLKQKFPTIEQYISGPSMEKDTSKWLTRIISLVE